MTLPAFTPSVTRIGVSPSGLTKEIRAKLTALARRGIAICRRLLGRPDRDRRHDRGTKLLAYLCENLDRAMTDLTIADHRIASLERALAAASVRIDQLKAKARAPSPGSLVPSSMVPSDIDDIRAEVFEEKTKKKEAPPELRRDTRTGVMDVTAGVR